MPRAPRQIGRCLIALAALSAAMAWGSASASACAAMRATSNVACRASCACCQRAPAAEAPRRAEVRPVAPESARACDVAPAEDCGCQPAPAEAPAAENRRHVEPPRPRLLPTGMVLAPIASPAPASFGPSRPAGGGPPPARRLYLLNARFLI